MIIYFNYIFSTSDIVDIKKDYLIDEKKIIKDDFSKLVSVSSYVSCGNLDLSLLKEPASALSCRKLVQENVENEFSAQILL